MQKFFTNSLTVSLLLLIAFRIVLLVFWGSNRDGNFLILVILPFLVFLTLTYLGKTLYSKFKTNH